MIILQQGKNVNVNHKVRHVVYNLVKLWEAFDISKLCLILYENAMKLKSSRIKEEKFASEINPLVEIFDYPGFAKWFTNKKVLSLNVSWTIEKIFSITNLKPSLARFESAQNRSSHRRCSIKKGVLKNFAKFTGKHLCQSLLSFPVNFAKF